jgi:hypothetical protein
VVDGRVCDVVNILLCFEPLKLNPDLALIGGGDSTIINLGTFFLQTLKKTDRLEVSCHADILGN